MQHWKNYIFESDPKPKAPGVPTSIRLSTPTPFSGSPVSVGYQGDPPSAIGDMPSSGNAAYKTLHEQTDFDQTDTGKLLKKYLDPLAKIQMDERSKMKAALAQAQAQDGLTMERVLSTFDSLKQTLMVEQGHFKDAVASHGVADQQTKIDDTKKQIETLQQTLIQLSTEMAQQAGKLSRAQSDFDSAFAMRNAELDQQKQHYATLLQ